LGDPTAIAYAGRDHRKPERLSRWTVSIWVQRLSARASSSFNATTLMSVLTLEPKAVKLLSGCAPTQAYNISVAFSQRKFIHGSVFCFRLRDLSAVAKRLPVSRSIAHELVTGFRSDFRNGSPLTPAPPSGLVRLVRAGCSKRNARLLRDAVLAIQSSALSKPDCQTGTKLWQQILKLTKPLEENGAGDRGRTGDVQLGNPPKRFWPTGVSRNYRGFRSIPRHSNASHLTI
jgi:hypothetical protein